MQMRILQIDRNKDVDYDFMDYDYAITHGFSLDDYKCVWEENIDSDTDLDEIFTRFNINHPEGYRGHSLSVSDIVDLEGHLYYCDGMGWVELNKEK